MVYMSATRRIAQIYDYRDASKELRYQVVRYEPKDFRQRRPKSPPARPGRIEWDWNMAGVRRLLYRLPEILAAPEDRIIYFVEGEKDADNLARLGMVATTIAGGSNARWTPALVEPLRGRSVLFIPDNDEPGRAFVRAGANALQGVAKEIGCVELPGLPEKGDFSDWIEMPGNDLSALLKLPIRAVEKGRRGEAEKGREDNGSGSPSPPLPRSPSFDVDRDLLKLEEIEAQRIEWLWKPWLPKGKMCMIDGDPGLGKSFVTLDLAARLSRGDPFPDGIQGPGVPTASLIIACEDSIRDTMIPRLQAMSADLRFIRCWQGEQRDGCLYRLPRVPDDLDALEAMIVACNARLVIIDPLMAFLSESVNSISDQSVRAVLAPLGALAEKLGVTIVFVRNLNKTNGKNAVYRGGGSIGITASMRSSMLIGRHPFDRELRVLAMVKTNIGAEPKSQGFKLQPARYDIEQREVCWIGPVDLFANDLVGDVKEQLNPKEWLKSALSAGPRLAQEVIEEGATAGYSERTLTRAKASLGIVARQRKGKDRKIAWWWLPVGQTDFHRTIDEIAMGDFEPIPDFDD